MPAGQSGVEFYALRDVAIGLDRLGAADFFSVFTSHPGLADALVFQVILPNPTGTLTIPGKELMTAVQALFKEEVFLTQAKAPTDELVKLSGRIAAAFSDVAFNGFNWKNLAQAMVPGASDNEWSGVIGSPILSEAREADIREALKAKGRVDGVGDNYELLPGDSLFFGGVLFNSVHGSSYVANPKNVNIYMNVLVGQPDAEAPEPAGFVAPAQGEAEVAAAIAKAAPTLSSTIRLFGQQ